jgi:hypothetical protein
VTVRVTATDNVAVTGVTMWSGATRLGTLTKQSDGSWGGTLPSRSYPNATYPVHARAVDAAGNTGYSATISLTLRN